MPLHMRKLLEEKMNKPLTRNKRTKFVVYEPDYVPDGQFKRLSSWYKVHKLCAKWGPGTKVCVKVLKSDTKFWRTEDLYTCQ
jgi:hypothetical protein